MVWEAGCRSALFLLVLVSAVGCSQTGPATPALHAVPEPAPGGPVGPGLPHGILDRPFPTSTIDLALVPESNPMDPVLRLNPASIMSTTTAAIPLSPGWTRYASINEILDLAFSTDGTLWVATSGGLVHWNLESRSYTRYQVYARHISLDSTGAPWLATTDGLCRLIRSACEPFIPLADVGTSAVLSLLVTPEGAVWAGTATGVARFDGTDWKLYPSAVPTFDLAVTTDGVLWAATAAGIGRYLPAYDTWVTYSEQNGLPSTQAQVIAAGPRGDVWASITWEGLARFDGERWQRVAGPTGGLVGDIAVDRDGKAWVGTVGSLHYPGGSLSYWDGSLWIPVEQQSAGEGEAVLSSFRAVASGPGGVIAAATSLGLGVYERDQWHLLRDGPMSERVTSTAVTPDGAAWFGFGDHSISTPGCGLSRFDGQTWKYFLGDAEVNALAVARDGALWAGSGCTIQRFDGASWETVAQCEGDLPPGSVLDLEFAGDGTAWVATGFGLARYDGQAWTTYDMLANSLVPAPDGSIWTNSWKGEADSSYITRLDPVAAVDEWTTFHISESHPGAFYLHAVTSDGWLWGVIPGVGVASFDGREWTAAESWRIYPLPGDLPLRGGFHMAISQDGKLWVATPRGAAHMAAEGRSGQEESTVRRELWTEYTADCDVPAGTLRPIASGPGGEVWFGATRFQSQQTSD